MTIGESLRMAWRQGVGTPLFMLSVLALMIVPLPPLLLDGFFTFSISLALVVLLVAVYTQRPLDFAIFPTVLLLATLLRLALNVASTRVVLLHGHAGTDAAGQVIKAFGQFVVGGNYAVGLVVFVVLVIINFVVVTKGAGRISEVSARFVLDAMPGKQMAVDADLNAGAIDQAEAKRRRSEITREADFYGAMDGASKFVRGDAIAGILIVFINIVGGLAIGVVQHQLPFVDALRQYTLLTIGDGLVAQIPALLLSTAAALMVTRVSQAHDMGRQILTQLFGSHRAIGVTAAIIGAMGIVPGMPNAVFLGVAAACAGLAAFLARRQPAGQAPAEEQAAGERPRPELSWEDVATVDPISMEIGYRLVPLVDERQDGPLMSRIRGVRKKLTQEAGFLVPTVHIRDNLALAPDAYRISLQDAMVGQGTVYPDLELAINPGQVSGKVNGIDCRDPAFGLPATWIEASLRDHAQSLGYTVVDPATVIATHLSQIIQKHAHELFSYEDTRRLLDRLATVAPKLVEDLTPALLPLGTIHRVLQNLLREMVPIRDIRSIAHALIEAAAVRQDSDALTAAVRVAMGRVIVQRINDSAAEVRAITLEPALEHLLLQSIRGDADSDVAEPGLMSTLTELVKNSARRQESEGFAPVFVVTPRLRGWIGRLVRQSAPGAHVLSFGEIPDDQQINIVDVIGANQTALAAPG
jgi:flagellar biosynthesis protein FlhA